MFHTTPILTRMGVGAAFAGAAISLAATPALAGPDGFADIAEQAKPAVVTVLTEAGPEETATTRGFEFDGPSQDFMERFFGERGIPMPTPDDAPMRQGLGSGFIIDSDGIIVTNNHVIDGAEQITVVLDDGQRLEAHLVGVDAKTDLAVLEVEADVSLPAIQFGSTDDLRVGDWVVALGNPFGIGASVTAGIVSARGRDIRSGPYDDFIQVDAPINRGNSGGPLLDGDGNVVGVNTAIYSPSGGNVGIGFAIPAELAQRVVDDLRDDGQVDRGWIGVSIQPVTPEIAESLDLDEASGALIADVVADGPASQADLRQGDVILSFGGQAVDSLRDLTRAVADLPAGEKAEVGIWRNGAGETVELTVGHLDEDQVAAAENPSAQKSELLAGLGFGAANLTAENRARYGLDDEATGAVVVDVDPAGPAAAKGLRPGDVVTRLGQSEIASLGDLTDGLESAKEEGRKTALLLIEREGNSRFVGFDLSVS